MEEMFSKREDIVFIAKELKKILEEKISINTFTLVNEVLTGKICLDETKITRFNGIDFNIKFSKGEFLRLNVGEIYILSPYEVKEETLKVLMEAISQIQIDGCILGNPDAFYQIEENRTLIPYCEWIFTKKEEYLAEMKNNTLFDDASIKNLIIFNEENEKQLQKVKENN